MFYAIDKISYKKLHRKNLKKYRLYEIPFNISEFLDIMNIKFYICADMCPPKKFHKKTCFARILIYVVRDVP